MKIAIAMSGGVDSSVAAKILCDEGHKVVGLFLKLWSDPKCNIKGENKCCDYEALDDARRVATKLDIPFYVINARNEFKKEVVDYFLNEYKNLRTPNPCVVCNDRIKFGLLLKRALEIGCDRLATGHYARIVEDDRIMNNELGIKVSDHNNHNSSFIIHNSKQFKLLAGIDKTKDQSYMLYHLSQDQLLKVIFPLGEMKKIDVRKLAKKWHLLVYEKSESQEICFFGDKDYRSFLARYLPKKYFKPGKIIDKKGNILGEHQGLINYTIGQRRQVNQELRIMNNGSDDKKPLYVIGHDIKINRLIVGKDKEVYSKEMVVSDLNWIDLSSLNSLFKIHNSLSVKIRYRHEAVPCRITNNELQIKGSEDIRVLFDEPQRAITPGQSAVFYQGDEVLGGGVIR